MRGRVRRRILVFEGGYHGGFLAFPPGGSRVNVPHEFVIAPYNDIDATLRLIGEAGEDLAAVLVEPMLGAGGCIPAEPAFLEMLRAETERLGAILIFDEVMTSRLSPGGRQALLGITPDMTTLGKYIGGGLTFGAFGGRAYIMAQFDPRRADALFHAGTFNNNTVTMAAGVAGLTKILTPERSRDLNARGLRQIAAGLDRLRRQYIPSFGNFLTFHAGAAAQVYQRLLQQGVIVRPIAGYGMPEHLRVSIGLESENERFLQALQVALHA